MLPFLISKTAIQPLRKQKAKEKSFYVTGDNVTSLKPRRRKPLRLPPMIPAPHCDCNFLHLTRIMIQYAPRSRKRLASTTVMSKTSFGTTGELKRMKLRPIQPAKKSVKKEALSSISDEFFKRLEVHVYL